MATGGGSKESISTEPAELAAAAPAGSRAALEQLLGQMVQMRSEMEPLEEQQLETTPPLLRTEAPRSSRAR